MHVIAAKAVAFGEALRPSFKTYANNVVTNCQAMAAELENAGYALVSGGTDTHLALVDLRPKGVKGNAAEQALERAYITCNKNGVPFDQEKPTITSGIRIGSPATTTRGLNEGDFRAVGAMIVRVLDALANNAEGDTALEADVRAEVEALTARYPLYGDLH
jgi:glycine hydroxymethyltransferase